jgi:hypothetical protein
MIPLDLDMPLTCKDVDEMTDWAGYKRAERGHTAGDHSRCDPNRCHAAERLCILNEERLEAVAILALIKARRLDAVAFLGNDYHSTVALASADYPDFPYIQPEPDRVHQLQARVLIGQLDKSLSVYRRS